ncbi:MAG TPA: hypothetical protein VGE04_08650 [Chloroflexia bacterium]
MSGRARRYFFAFLPFVALIALPLGFGCAIGTTREFGAPLGLLLAFLAAALYAGGFAGFLTWLASRRRVLARPQEVRGLHALRYLDLAAPQPIVFSECAGILRSVCKASPVMQDLAKGLLSCELRPNFWTWGTEISLWVEPLGDAYTRVQLLSRPIVPTNVIDFGASRRNVNLVVEMLRGRFTVVAEG